VQRAACAVDFAYAPIVMVVTALSCRPIVVVDKNANVNETVRRVPLRERHDTGELGDHEQADQPVGKAANRP